MKKSKNIFLRLSLGLLASICLSGCAVAECTRSPDCAGLGYDKIGCANGDNIIRCPFDSSKVNCIPMTCEGIGKKTCGKGCIDPAQCCTDRDCATGQICNSCTKTCEHMICTLGDIYYSDKTCSTELISGKTPIGAVGYITNGGKNGVVIALDTAYDNKTGGIQWGCFGTDLSLTNYASQSLALNDFSGKSNTDVIAGQCESTTAADYCKNTYSKGGVSGWYLPAYGELYALLYTNFDTVNSGLGKIPSANQIAAGSWYWSSSEKSNNHSWKISSGSTTSYANHKDYAYYVRCVLAF